MNPLDVKNQIESRVEWLTHTDADGRFAWDSAPTEETCFWLEADVYLIIRSFPILPDGMDHEIKMKRKNNASATR